MKILVPVKRVVDSNVKIRLLPDGTGVDLTSAKMSMNPFCEIAVEEALRIRETTNGSEVVVVSIGPSASQDVLRNALAMGADRGLLIKVDSSPEPLAVAKILKSVIEEDDYDLVIMGKQAIDDDCNQTGQMLAALLGWPQGTFASKVTVETGRVEVTREVDAGQERVSLKLPAIVTADLRLNEPRYASITNIMKAKKKPLEVRDGSVFSAWLPPRLRVLKTTQPPSRAVGVKLGSVKELVSKLQTETGLL